MDKEGKRMSPTTLAKIADKKKSMTEESKKRMLIVGGSLKTKYAIDAQEICREVRGK